MTLKAAFLCLSLLVYAVEVQAQRPLGIDVSSFQGSSINWNSVRTSGVSFAWCKATEGVTFKDSTFGVNITNARNAGVLIGAYHYARPDNNPGLAGAVQEAGNFWGSVSNYLKADGTYLMPVLDIEAPGVTGPPYTRSSLSQWVHAWCTNIVARAAAVGVAVNPIVYTYVSYSATWLWADSTATQWPLWMAQYPASPNPQTDSPSGTSPWLSWQVWQYSATGSVPGVPGNCDLNVFNGTSNQLAALVIGAPLPPVLLSSPASRTVDPGASLTLSASAGGAMPQSYQWRRSGTNLPGATSSTYAFPSLQAAQAGTYSVVVTNLFGAVTSAVATITVNLPYTPVFVDNFDVNSAANWTLNRSSADNRVTFAWDYAALGIPAAPNSGGATKGLRFEANLSAGATNALNVSPIGQGFPTNSRLRFDLWINVNGDLPDGGVGSTEAVTAGVGTAGNRVQWNASGSSADGAWFAVTGEGGAGDTSAAQGDFVAYNGTAQLSAASGAYSAGTSSTSRGNGNAYYYNVFPAGQAPPPAQVSGYPQQIGSLIGGTVGFKWRDVVIRRSGGTVEWFIDGLKIATVNGVSTAASNIFVGYWDPFPSVSDNTNLSFGLVDNLRVEVPAVAPVITAPPAALWASLGGHALFSMTATGLPAPNYQWRRNGTNIAAATNATLSLSPLTGPDAGTYSAVVANLAGSVISSNALLSLIAANPPSLAFPGAPSGGTVSLTAVVDLGATYALESSTNLVNWTALTNVVAAGSSLNLVVPVSADAPQNFYRLRSGP